MSFTSEFLDAEGTINCVSAVIDNQNKVHVAYGAVNGDTRLKYATNAAGAWVCIIASSEMGKNVGDYCSIVADSAKNPRIAYTTKEGVLYSTYYASKSGNTWSYEPVFDLGGKALSIGISPENDPAITLLHNLAVENPYIVQAYRDGSGWHSRTDASQSWSGGNTSLAYNNVNNWLDVAFISALNGFPIKHGTFEAVPAVGNMPTTTAKDVPASKIKLKIDLTGKPHIVYYRSDQQYIGYCYLTDTGWQDFANLGTDLDCTDIDMVLDQNNKAHLCYTVFDHSDAQYKVYYANNVSGSWCTDRVNISSSSFSHCAIARETNGRIHIIYSEQGDGLYHTYSP
jgi:hypothetical protein